MFIRILFALAMLCGEFSLFSLTVDINNTTSRTVYVLFAGNNLVVDNTTGTIPQNSSLSFVLTSVSAGRIYISYDYPLSSSSPDGANPSDPDYLKRFDKVELSYANGAGMANLTSVDFYAIPFVLQTQISSLPLNVDQFTLAPNTTGSALKQALLNVSTDQSLTNIVNSQETVRVLSPVKAPKGYPSLKSYVDSTVDTTFSIVGNYFSANGLIPYNFSGEIGSSKVTMTMPGRQTITLKTKELVNKKDDVDSNAIYTCNGVYYLSGSGSTPHYVSDNDYYAAVYRDFISGFNFGYMGGAYGNTSSNWWGNQPYAMANTNYNQYASVIYNLYPGAYGFPFSDTQEFLLADLGGLVDTLAITVLEDSATPPAQTYPGVLNPQTGIVTFNAVLISANDVQNAPFTFGLNSMEFGWINDYHNGAQTNLHNGTGAQILNIDAQEGYNQYELTFGNHTYTVIVQVVSGVIQVATIAGGGNSNWSSPNLFIGGLQTNP
jgi:hypothetical protein